MSKRKAIESFPSHTEAHRLNHFREAVTINSPSTRCPRRLQPRLRRLGYRLFPLALVIVGVGVALRSHSAPNNPPHSTAPALPPPVSTPASPSSPAPGASALPPEVSLDSASLPQPDVQAVSAILIDAVSGEVLYEKNADERRPMASTTKIMTALLFCESVKEGEIVSASSKACQVKESSLHLKPGEKLTSNDMLCAILMRSANDGCVAAAERAAGSEAVFVAKMNQRAAELGATNTHFMNPHGLHNKLHYTTARDLALIARAAIQQPRIREVVCLEKCKIVRSMNTRDVTMRNHSHFLGHYDGADGIKTGWTIPAGHCYVGSATRNGWQLISVVLKSPNYVHETAEMMNFGFGNFERHEVNHAGDIAGDCTVQNGIRPSVAVTVGRPLQFVTRKGEGAEFTRHVTLAPTLAPVVAGSALGSLEVLVGGRQVTSSPLVALNAVPVAPPVVKAAGSLWGRFVAIVGIFAAGLVSLRYGTRFKTRFTASAKGARRRRSRLAPSLRDDDYGG